VFSLTTIKPVPYIVLYVSGLVFQYWFANRKGDLSMNQFFYEARAKEIIKDLKMEGI